MMVIDSGQSLGCQVVEATNQAAGPRGSASMDVF